MDRLNLGSAIILHRPTARMKPAIGRNFGSALSRVGIFGLPVVLLKHDPFRYLGNHQVGSTISTRVAVVPTEALGPR